MANWLAPNPFGLFSKEKFYVERRDGRRMGGPYRSPAAAEKAARKFPKGEQYAVVEVVEGQTTAQLGGWIN
jgi:hypothetical protein